MTHDKQQTRTINHQQQVPTNNPRTIHNKHTTNIEQRKRRSTQCQESSLNQQETIYKEQYTTINCQQPTNNDLRPITNNNKKQQHTSNITHYAITIQSNQITHKTNNKQQHNNNNK